MNREEAILGYIKSRKENNQTPIPCIFQITVPRCTEDSLQLREDENIKIITNLLDKYGIHWGTVDTIGGAYNLNRDWIETADIPCYVEYCGVYPVDWDTKDSALLEQMEYDGKIIVKVLWHTSEGEYIDNH